MVCPGRSAPGGVLVARRRSQLADETRPTVLSPPLGKHDADAADLDALTAMLYEDLRMVAHRQRRRWFGNDTLRTTALVHEAYLKLHRQRRIEVESRGHFLALASMAMRHILSHYAEQRRTQKRGGEFQHVSIADTALLPAADSSTGDVEEILAAMNGALERLERTHARACRVVECRFYGGLTIEETAVAIGISPRTVKRDWTFAQTWLKRELKGTI
jgi:RNA polymerase sigma factor (TIGR02999 family)